MKTKNTKNNMSYLKESKKRKRREDGSDRGAESLEKSLGLRSGKKYSAQSKLQIPALQTNNGPSLTTFTTTATHLAKRTNKEPLPGSLAAVARVQDH